MSQKAICETAEESWGGTRNKQKDGGSGGSGGNANGYMNIC